MSKVLGVIRRRTATARVWADCGGGVYKGLWLELYTTDLSLQPRNCDSRRKCIRRRHDPLDLYGRSIRLPPIVPLVLGRQTFLFDSED